MIVTLPRFVWPHYPGGFPTAVATSGTQDAAGELTEFVFVPAAGTITKLRFAFNTVTTSQPVKMSLQGVGADGNADGTILGATANCYGTHDGPFVANTMYEVTLGEPLTVDGATRIAFVFDWVSTVGNMRLMKATGQVAFDTHAHTGFYTAGAWTRAVGAATVIPVYTGDEIKEQNYTPTIDASDNFNTGTTPDEVGNYFLATHAFRVIGLAAILGLVVSQSTTLKLYAADDTLLGSAGDNSMERIGGYPCSHLFSAPVVLTPGAYYRKTILPGGATNMACFQVALGAAAELGVLPGGTGCIGTGRADAGAWTNVATERWGIWLICDGIDVAAGRPAYGDKNGGRN